jgi:hypothetical protein
VRLSDAERERLFAQLSRHAAAGRLDVAQLEQRVAAIAAAQTREEADAVMADLPEVEPHAVTREPERQPRWGRGHGEVDAAGADWTPTGERFRDPKSGKVMRVWVDPAGGRHYLAEA